MRPEAVRRAVVGLVTVGLMAMGLVAVRPEAAEAPPADAHLCGRWRGSHSAISSAPPSSTAVEARKASA